MFILDREPSDPRAWSLEEVGALLHDRSCYRLSYGRPHPPRSDGPGRLVLIRRENGSVLLFTSISSISSFLFSGSRVKFNLDQCVYRVQLVTGAEDCPDLGRGPFLVKNANAFGVDLPMYTENGGLSVYGWLFTVFGTWIGQLLMISSILWITDLPSKLWGKFRALRGGGETRSFEQPLL